MTHTCTAQLAIFIGVTISCCFACSSHLIVCEYNGQTYLPGDSFPATDGCNTWWVCPQQIVVLRYLNVRLFNTGINCLQLFICSTCSDNGLVACTERACLPKCKSSLCSLSPILPMQSLPVSAVLCERWNWWLVICSICVKCMALMEDL